MVKFDLSRWTRLETSPRNLILIAALLVGIALLAAVHMFSGGPSMPTLGRYYYSVNNGRTFFASHAIHIPPFAFHGKPAVAAGVFVNVRGLPFVAYVYKYDPTGRGMVASGISTVNGQRVDNGAMREQAARFCYVSKPGGKQWVLWTSPAGQKIVHVRDPATGQPLKPYTGG